MRTRWTNAERETLRTLWRGHESVEQVAKALGRTVYSVEFQAERLGLYDPPPNIFDRYAPKPERVIDHGLVTAHAGGFRAIALKRPRKAPPLPSEREPAKPNRFTHLIVVTGGKATNLPKGVERIERRPITDSIVKFARRYVANGTPLDTIAESFSVDPDALERALGREVAA